MDRIAGKIIVNTIELCDLLDVQKNILDNWYVIGCPKYDRDRWDLKAVLEWRKANGKATAIDKVDGKIIVSTTDLCYLLNVSYRLLSEWSKAGCPKFEWGRWDLKAVLEWRKANGKATAIDKVDGKIIVNTLELCELLGVSRQTIIDWGSAGCPKYERNQWDLKAVLEWRKIAGKRGVNVKKHLRKCVDDFNDNALKRIYDSSEAMKAKIKDDCNDLSMDNKIKMLVVNSLCNCIDEIYHNTEKEIQDLIRDLNKVKK